MGTLRTGDGWYLAHGIGGAKDLPIPPQLAIAGAVAALTISFTVLALAWREPRFVEGRGGRPVWWWVQAVADSRALVVVARLFGLWFVGWGAWAAIAGQDILINPVLGMVFVLLWVGIVPASLLLGPFWKAVSPARTVNWLLAKATGGDPEDGVWTYPARLGYWPAALGLLSFVWFELIYLNRTEIGAVRLWFAVYFAVLFVGGALFGNSFYKYADPFEVYSTLVGKLSVWHRRTEGGVLHVRSPLANLATIVPAPGLVPVIAVLLGSTAYDSLSNAPWWVAFVQGDPLPVGAWPEAWGSEVSNLALVGIIVAVGGLFVAATMSTGVDADTPRRALPGLFAHAIVPIVVGYVAAHYLTYLVRIGQQTVVQMSDPLSNGSNLLGTGDLAVSYWLDLHPTLVANIKVLAIVLGHIVGAVAAHDRALTLLPKRHQLTGQLGLLVLMVGYTAGGLFLLFSG